MATIVSYGLYIFFLLIFRAVSEDHPSCDISKSTSDRCQIRSHFIFKQHQNSISSARDVKKPCRSEPNGIFICDSFETKEIPSLEEIPNKLTIFKLTETQVTRIENYSFSGIDVLCIQILKNPNFTHLELYAFVGVQRLQEIIIQNNKLFTLADNPSFAVDFYYPFSFLSDLVVLVLERNNLNLSNVESKSNNESGPCLEILDFSSNRVEEIGANFLQAFSCGNVHSLYLANSNVSHIDKDAFVWTPRLRRLDLSNSGNLSSLEPALHPLKNLTFLDLSINNFNSFPRQALQRVSGSLEELNFTLNVFNDLKFRDFPYMPKLKILILDSCRIRTIEQDTFLNLPALEHLSLKLNVFVEIPILRSYGLKSLFFEMFPVPGIPNIFEHAFSNLKSLEELSLVSLNLGELKPEIFHGLRNLTTLRLEKSSITNIQQGTFSVLPNLKNLMMANCANIHTPTVEALNGSKSLETIDLSFVSIFGKSKSQAVELAFENAKDLNLTGSLGGIEQPMDFLHFYKMPKLEKLNLSKNPISDWNVTKFYNNTNLTNLVMQSTHEYVSLTMAMVLDFKELDHLDMTNTKFICNEGVRLFCQLMEEANPPIVEGWNNGSGYFCKDDKDVKHTFYNYSYSGEPMQPGYPGSHDEYFKNLLFGIGGLAIFVMFAVGFAYAANTQWWYWKYLIAKRHSQRRKYSTSESFNYDCFVSYNSNDSNWVHSQLVSHLEMDCEGEFNSPLKLCLHERDFQIGQNITENIVACLENSQNCILVLTEDYAKSRWCNFEAEVANHIFTEQKRIDQLLIVLPSGVPSKYLSQTLKFILKSRTYLEWTPDSGSFFKRLRSTLRDPVFIVPNTSELNMQEIFNLKRSPYE